MRNAPLSISVLAVALALSAAPAPPAHAAVRGVQRCTNGDGSSIYTDTSCAALGATPVPMPADLVARLASTYEGRASDASFGGVAYDAGMHLQPFTGSHDRRPVRAGCARTPTQLAMDLRGALALGDVNRVAASYHWVDVSQSQASHVMQRLARLGGHEVIDTRYFNAAISSGIGRLLASNARPANAAGILQVTFGDDAATRQVDFDVVQFADCWFVRY